MSFQASVPARCWLQSADEGDINTANLTQPRRSPVPLSFIVATRKRSVRSTLTESASDLIAAISVSQPASSEAAGQTFELSGDLISTRTLTWFGLGQYTA